MGPCPGLEVRLRSLSHRMPRSVKKENSPGNLRCTEGVHIARCEFDRKAVSWYSTQVFVIQTEAQNAVKALRALPVGQAEPSRAFGWETPVRPSRATTEGRP